MCKFSANVAFSKVSNGQTDIKLETGKTLSSMSLLKIVGEKLPRKDRVFGNDEGEEEVVRVRRKWCGKDEYDGKRMRRKRNAVQRWLSSR